MRETSVNDDSAITVHVGGTHICTGVISGGIPALSQIHGITLTSPVALMSNVLIAESTSGEHSAKDLLLLLGDIEVASLSIGCNGDKVVMAATHNTSNGFVINKPFVSVAL